MGLFKQEGMGIISNNYIALKLDYLQTMEYDYHREFSGHVKHVGAISYGVVYTGGIEDLRRPIDQFFVRKGVLYRKQHK